MKNNQTDQLNRGKIGDKPNQKSAEVSGKKDSSRNTQTEKKGKQNMNAQDTDEQEELSSKK